VKAASYPGVQTPATFRKVDTEVEVIHWSAISSEYILKMLRMKAERMRLI